MEKKMHQALQSNKEKKHAQDHSHTVRKQDEDFQMRQRAKRIMEKFESSGKAV